MRYVVRPLLHVCGGTNCISPLVSSQVVTHVLHVGKLEGVAAVVAYRTKDLNVSAVLLQPLSVN